MVRVFNLNSVNFDFGFVQQFWYRGTCGDVRASGMGKDARTCFFYGFCCLRSCWIRRYMYWNYRCWWIGLWVRSSPKPYLGFYSFFSFRFSILSSSDININNCVLFFVSALVAKISISERLPILLFRIVYRVAHLVVLPLPLLLISSISLWVSFLTFQFAIL